MGDNRNMNTQKATFGAGCFWCAEAAFKLLPGVIFVVLGYIGGNEENPSYEEVSSKRTGHVEAVQVKYDPARVSYEQLLKIFWEIHNPTEENKQGPDIGLQYQAVIFAHTDEQKELVEKTKKDMALKLGQKIATKILPFRNFYPAEEYHRNFYEKNPNTPYSKAVIAPKIKKVKKLLDEYGEE